MNTPNPTLASETDALRGDLRPCKQQQRPIHHPPDDQSEPIGGRR
jgi:hypothetical protein